MKIGNGFSCSRGRQSSSIQRTCTVMSLVLVFAGIICVSTLSSSPSARSSGDQRLVRAIADHFRYSIGFRTKFKTGYRRLPPKSEQARKQAARAMAAILERLAASSSGNRKNLVLIHHIAAGGNLDVWLIGPDGVLASSTSAKPYEGLRGLESSLDIPTRAARYAPQRRDAKHVPSINHRRQSSAEALRDASDVLLTTEVKRILTSESGRLLILPDRDTGTAPYGALPLQDGRPLVERWSVVVVPDIETLARHERVFNPSSIDLRMAVVVGDPDLSFDSRMEWPELPGARAEAVAIGKLLSIHPSRVLIGADATKVRVMEAIDGYDSYGKAGLIYLASHGVADPVNPMDGGFVALTGGHLYGRDLRGNRFEEWEAFHPLVVLSACQTGLGKVFDGGTYGIARAWLSAGAGQVVASLWRVSDEATMSLMTRFVALLKAGSAPEEALRAAQREAAVRFSADPAAWAGFSVFGAPSMQPQ